MNEIFHKLKTSALNTEYPRWKNIVSTIFLTVMCLLMVVNFWYLVISTNNIECHKGFLYLSVAWVAAELLVIAYMFHYNTIPAFARASIGLFIALSNIWFGLFLFGLKSCGASD